MARQKSEAKQRKDTENALKQALELNNATDKFLLDQVSEYMCYYDNLKVLNDKLKERFDVDILREKRQVTKEMRNILSFLGLKPIAEGGGGFEEL